MSKTMDRNHHNEDHTRTLTLTGQTGIEGLFHLNTLIRMVLFLHKNSYGMSTSIELAFESLSFHKGPKSLLKASRIS